MCPSGSAHRVFTAAADELKIAAAAGGASGVSWWCTVHLLSPFLILAPSSAKQFSTGNVGGRLKNAAAIFKDD